MGIVSQVRHQLGTRIEADHNCFVFFPDDAVNEVRGGLLLEPESIADAVARVDQDGEPQRKIGFRGELQNVLWLFVLRDLKIALVEIGNESAVLIGHGE